MKKVLLTLCGALLLVLVLTPGAQAQGLGDDRRGVNQAELDAAKAVQAKHEASLMSQGGVVAVGVGLMEDGRSVGIHVYVRKDEPRPALPAQLDGVGVRVIESNGFVAHDACGAGGPPCHEDIEARPVRLGTSTGNVNGIFAGTLGYRVFRRGNTNDVGYITNNHVAAASGANLCPASLIPANLPAFGVAQCQPGRLDAPGNVCMPFLPGNLVQVVPLIMGQAFLNTVDAAFVQSGRGCVSKTIRDIGPQRAQADFPVLNDIYQLSGRTSGLIAIKVVTINAMVDVSHPNPVNPVCGVARFVNQAITAPVAPATSASRPGDSGAPVVKGRLPRGLNFAGDGFFGAINPMPLVLDALGVQIDIQADAPGIPCFLIP